MGAVAAGLFFGGAGAAVAASWHELPQMHTTGVEFADGEYKFNPAGKNHGSFEWRGYLRDDAPRDGHNVYMQVKVEGHGWVRYNGKQRKTVHMHHSNWDGAQRYTEKAYIRACRDRGSLRPDNCSPEQYRHR
ncbi:hypothetical protein DN402_23500 [Streptomyces sp. SW4]|nr:hypothetical protein DN402_23500 [Streptomyces sp. SW4]